MVSSERTASPTALFAAYVTLLNNAVICHKGNDATSIPSQCCVYPYILNGGLYYNCTVYTPFSNDFGCYHSNGQWVTCQQPEGMLLIIGDPIASDRRLV